MREDNLVSNIKPLQTRISSVISSSTDFELHPDCTLIEVTAKGAGIYIKYGVAVSIADDGFDEYVHAGQTRHYPVAGGITIYCIEESATATLHLIERIM